MPDEQTMEMEAAEILRRLMAQGYQAFFVGGFVRDRLLGRNVKDIDIATSALPEQVIQCFPKTVPTGLQHGTVTVMMSRHAFEVTTFRAETEYENNRRPKSVEFISDLTRDLARRDFTMNAMAMDVERKLIDPFGGSADLKSGVLRCVGDPKLRFSEDALRMLRCIRFAAVYDLEIDPLTWNALLQQRARFQAIAMERVRAELERIVEGPYPARGLKLLYESGLLQFLKVDLGASFRLERGDVAGELASLAQLASPELRWTYLLLGSRMGAKQAETVLHRLTFSRKKSREIIQVLAFHEWLAEQIKMDRPPSKFSEGHTLESWREVWIQGALTYGRSALEMWLTLMQYETVDYGQTSVSSILASGRTWLAAMPVSSLKELAVAGSDLIAAGVVSGPGMKKTLEQMLWRAATGTVPNEKAALLRSAGLL